MIQATDSAAAGAAMARRRLDVKAGAMSVSMDRVAEQVQPATLNAVGWTAGEDLPYEEWLRQGSRLGLAGRNASWWVGDWLRYGTHRYGQKYSAAVRVTGYDRQTLMNLVYVANRFQISRRREALSWSHHAEVAALESQEQERWLDRAAADKLTIRDLREELSSVKDAAALAGKGRAPALATRARSKPAHQDIVCPECGHRFTPSAADE